MSKAHQHPEQTPASQENDEHDTHKHNHEHHDHQHSHRHDREPHDHHGHGHRHRHAHAHGHHQHAPVDCVGPIVTVRASSGLSGDMMLSGMATLAEVQNSELEALVKELKLPPLEGALTIVPRSVNHIAGVGCRIELPHEHAHRSLTDIEKIIASSAMPDDAKELSLRAFSILGESEAAVHSKKASEVTFHEVGALDSILDTCLVCRLFTILKPTRFICSPLPLADGVIHCAHGHVPSPAPAVLRLLRGIPVTAFSGTGETVTPTAVALLKALDAEFGPWPSMRIEKTVISYGSKIFTNAPNGAIWASGV